MQGSVFSRVRDPLHSAAARVSPGRLMMVGMVRVAVEVVLVDEEGLVDEVSFVDELSFVDAVRLVGEQEAGPS